MDYCHPCRRHLNGALACPGCGSSVEELRAYADHADSHIAGDGYDGADAHGGFDAPGGPEGFEGTGASDADEPARPGRAQNRRRAKERGAPAQRDPAAGGRAARRDRKAAAHR
ncbi:hypothetical protein ACFSL4_07005, partial [Streptomyces caeni]